MRCKIKRQIIIGDIHGCFDELQKLLDKVGVNKDDEIISVGDFIDRVPKSLEVVEFIRNTDNVIAITGNPERKHLNRIFTYAQEITSFISYMNKFLPKWQYYRKT